VAHTVLLPGAHATSDVNDFAATSILLTFNIRCLCVAGCCCGQFIVCCVLHRCSCGCQYSGNVPTVARLAVYMHLRPFA
jgi:hypothetical protein